MDPAKSNTYSFILKMVRPKLKAGALNKLIYVMF
jgi:hypothetical protein